MQSLLEMRPRLHFLPQWQGHRTIVCTIEQWFLDFNETKQKWMLSTYRKILEIFIIKAKTYLG